MIKILYQKVNLAFSFRLLLSLSIAMPIANADVYRVKTPIKCDKPGWVKTASGCIKYTLYKEKTNPTVLAVFLHGDFWAGGVDYMADIAQYHASENIMTAAIVRPGYYDNQGNFSDGKMLGANDHYTLENVNILSQVVQEFKKKFNPKNVVLVGHSGGAAIASLIANEAPNNIDGLFLFACPCDVNQWRPEWKKSLNPINHIDHISSDIKIQAYVGSLDENTYPELTKSYIEKCKNRGLNAQMFMISNMGHNFRGIQNDQEFHQELKQYLQGFLNE